ncbi:hypothetical protein [Leisingera aquimarina]|uniref:hypothetical protein n=1 Tax=Leisingera aquimarina TaxID=476529 RepID=UPI0004897668|nr:hypothetical protein [Leisingera aquimarina]
MEIFSSALGTIVLVFFLSVWLDVARGPYIDAPLLRRRFFKKAIARLLGAMLAVIAVAKLGIEAIDSLLPNSAWAAGTILLLWAALSCFVFSFVRRSISRLRSEQN